MPILTVVEVAGKVVKVIVYTVHVMVVVKVFEIIGMAGKSMRPIVSVKDYVPTSLGLDVERVIVVPEIIRKVLVGDNV
jgi:hypothetical protein